MPQVLSLEGHNYMGHNYICRRFCLWRAVCKQHSGDSHVYGHVFTLASSYVHGHVCRHLCGCVGMCEIIACTHVYGFGFTHVSSYVHGHVYRHLRIGMDKSIAPSRTRTHACTQVGHTQLISSRFRILRGMRPPFARAWTQARPRATATCRASSHPRMP